MVQSDNPLYWYDAIAHDDAAQAIRDADTAIQDEVNNCDSFAMQHLDQWQSVISRATYDQKKADWNAAIAEMQQILGRAAPALEHCKEIYEQTDRGIQRRFG